MAILIVHQNFWQQKETKTISLLLNNNNNKATTMLPLATTLQQDIRSHLMLV